MLPVPEPPAFLPALDRLAAAAHRANLCAMSEGHDDWALPAGCEFERLTPAHQEAWRAFAQEFIAEAQRLPWSASWSDLAAAGRGAYQRRIWELQGGVLLSFRQTPFASLSPTEQNAWRAAAVAVAGEIRALVAGTVAQAFRRTTP